MTNGRSFNCPHSSALLFLTDGRPDDWTTEHFSWVKSLNKEVKAAMLTYTIGDDADAGILQKLACDNNGIYRHVADATTLDNTMAQYYRYFSGTYRSCDAIRWVEYLDVVTCSKQLTGCLPVYNGSRLYGVACMDVNLLIEPQCLKKSRALLTQRVV
eukprot:gb/GFBE01063694.1/.p1 GENE.gb/GFBE01063694.1/~~gb/GFBE01063694.1/.p1  ORF type:complete len:157 (+),score=33.59 gb/GFBE01063694.1/:1-471(+)